METLSTIAEGESGFACKASRAWLEKFRHQCGIHSVVRHGEAASYNKEAVEKYVGEFFFIRECMRLSPPASVIARASQWLSIIRRTKESFRGIKR